MVGKNNYEAPELEIIQLQQEEVIVTSSLGGTEGYEKSTQLDGIFD